MPRKADEFATSLEGKYTATIDRIGGDLFDAWRDAWQTGDVAMVEQVIDEAGKVIARRVSMMSDFVAWSSYQIGKIEVGEEKEVMFQWILDSGADHCPDCLALAARGPMPIDQLPGPPGDAGTECDGGCRCDLVEVAVQ